MAAPKRRDPDEMYERLCSMLQELGEQAKQDSTALAAKLDAVTATKPTPPAPESA